MIRHGVIPASRGGKVKTLLQTVAIGLYLLPLPDWLATVAAWVMGAAVVLTVVTGVDYVAPGAAAAPGRADAVVIAPGTPAADGAGTAAGHAEQVLDALVAAGATVAVAESLTGGLLTAALTEPAGASNGGPRRPGGLRDRPQGDAGRRTGAAAGRRRGRSARTSPARWRPAPGTASAPRTGWA